MAPAEPSAVEPLSPATAAARAELVRLGRRYFGLGWLYATAGNLSARVGDRVVITASGKHKGDLGPDDFVEVDLAGALRASGSPTGKASAETSIHLALYRAHPTAAFALHVHTVASTLVGATALAPTGIPIVAFEGVEMVKAWDLWQDGVRAELPVFPNHADVARIGEDVARHFAALPPGTPPVPALLVAAHGITAWGADAFTANRHLEATEFLCQLELARRR
ncbi:MAG: methylthioribulose 1-phosphate dehydratase [Myxococcota bacterium]